MLFDFPGLTVRAAVAVICFTVTVSLAAAQAGVSKSYEGYINGIDIIATPGQPVRCLAFVNKTNKPGSDSIQVATTEHRLQTALESASARGIRVEVSYLQEGPQKVLTRVRLLDRK